MTNTKIRDIVDTAAEAARLAMPPLIVTDTVQDFLDGHGIGTGPLAIDRIGEGQSNATFRIQRDGADVILRRGPRPPLPKSTHDMAREARVQTALAASGFPVPRIRAVETDESLLGVPFYVMDRLDGDVVTSHLPPRFDTAEHRRALVEETVATLAHLHSLDVTTPELSPLGRPDGYLERQVRRFRQLWPQNTRRAISGVEQLGQWLAAHLPRTQRHSVIHGDYRIGNLMFSPHARPTVQAVLDWEMATLGDPLADLGYLVATYASSEAQPTVMELTTVTRGEHFPDRAEIVDLYARHSDLDLSDLRWYEALALWKAAVFCEAIYTRWLDGEKGDDTDFAAELEQGVPDLLDAALELTD
jgi:aminoglycoside phosphotransferase (APT) family kinase protein